MKTTEWMILQVVAMEKMMENWDFTMNNGLMGCEWDSLCKCLGNFEEEFAMEAMGHRFRDDLPGKHGDFQ